MSRDVIFKTTAEDGETGAAVNAKDADILFSLNVAILASRLCDYYYLY